jgi:hypothetical protein
VAGCLGAAKLVVALASDPTTPIATANAEVVDPIEVNPAKACLVGNQVFHVEGNDPVLNGSLTVTDGTWTFPPTGVNPDFWRARLTLPGQTETWSLDFNATMLPGALLVGKVYEDIRRAEFAVTDQVPGHAALYVGRSGFECTTVTGTFQVVEYAVDFSTPDPGTKVATFYFEQHCNGDPTTALAGCVHFKP